MAPLSAGRGHRPEEVELEADHAPSVEAPALLGPVVDLFDDYVLPGTEIRVGEVLGRGMAVWALLDGQWLPGIFWRLSDWFITVRLGVFERAFNYNHVRRREE